MLFEVSIDFVCTCFGRLSVRHQHLKAIWVKAHFSDIVLGQESQIENNTDQVTLCAIVGLVIVSIDNVVFSSIQISGEVLECLLVERITEDVISMNSLQVVLVVMENSSLDVMDSLIKHGLHTVFVHVVLLFNRPFSIVFVKAVLVEVDFFIKDKLFIEYAWGQHSGASVIVEELDECLPSGHHEVAENHVDEICVKEIC